MKRLFQGRGFFVLNGFAALLVLIAQHTTNVTSVGIFHQPKAPESLLKKDA